MLELQAVLFQQAQGNNRSPTSKMNTHIFNLIVGAGAIVAQIISILILVLLLLRSKNKVLDWVGENFLLICFLIALGATVGSIIYSSVIGYAPCFLCWWQRVFMVPLVFLFGMAWKRKDRWMAYYAAPLFIIGALVAIYHNYIYYFGEGSGPCDASGVSCVQKLVSEFGGYISIPMLSLTAFFAIIVVILVAHFYKKEA
jgi:disulfide bond formation protein DsbB